jgi:plastocyanin
MAFADGAVFVPIVNARSDLSGSTVSVPDFATSTGELDAVDAATGKILWKADLSAPDLGGATVAGDLVFTSTAAGEVVGFDRRTGALVWVWQAPGGINGFPAVAGDTLLVPVGYASPPQLVALRIGGAAQPAPQSSPSPAGAAPAAGATQLSIGTPSANPLSFDPTTLHAAAGTQVSVQYTNDSTLPHNWHLFDGPSATAPSIAQTPINSGPGDVETAQFTAPTRSGSYLYLCDVHPTIMSGHLVVN